MFFHVNNVNRNMIGELSLRRLQRVGKATYSISLPKGWVRRRGLRPGDILEVYEESDGSLRIRSRMDKLAESSYLIDAELCRVYGQISKLITACYHRGCERIEVRAAGGLNEEIVKEISEVVSRLPGFEIIERTNKSIVLQNFIDPSKFSVRGLIRRLQTMISTMFGNISDFLFSRSYEDIKSIRDLREKIHQLHELIIRLLITYLDHRGLGRAIGLKNSTEAYCMVMFSDHVLRITEHLYNIGEEFLKFRKKIWRDKEILSLFRELIGITSMIFEDSINAFINTDPQHTMKILNQISNVIDHQLSGGELLKTRDLEKTCFIEKILCSLRGVMLECERIVEEIFDRFIENGGPVCMLKENSKSI
ncbi:MAG: hypothetical protein DRN49_02010 [Thaumarchaeota archaeon]|nr:MAG: hypothetical protein DRN49_02010 [Nitrososphaerota archaeon]